MSSSLSSVVSNLVRSSMGTSVSRNVTDDDLDRHVAELIVREAKKKAERYGQQGIRAYVSSNLSDPNAPKPNKRFLTSIIKSTDDHNKTLLRAQAQAAEQVKREREDQERRQRRARAEEAAEAERLRRSGRGSKRKRNAEDEVWDRWDGRTADRTRNSKNWDAWDRPESDSDDHDRPERYRGRDRSISRSREEYTRKPRPSRSDLDEEEVASRKRRRHHRSLSHSPRTVDPCLDWREKEPHHRKQRRSQEEHRHRRSRRSHSRFTSPAGTEGNGSKKRRRSHSPRYALDDTPDETPSTAVHRHLSPDVELRPNVPEANLEIRLKASQGQPSSNSHSKHKNSSESQPSSSKRSPSTGAPSSSPSPGPQLPIQLPSKMDRYFEESYDPRLDVAPLAAPKVPATGLIDNAEFEGWDAMLELIRVRREDKEEKRRMERLGLLPKAKSKSKNKGAILDSSLAVADRWGGDGVTVMDIEYKKRGTVREWDMGKEGF